MRASSADPQNPPGAQAAQAAALAAGQAASRLDLSPFAGNGPKKSLLSGSASVQSALRSPPPFGVIRLSAREDDEEGISAHRRGGCHPFQNWPHCPAPIFTRPPTWSLPDPVPGHARSRLHGPRWCDPSADRYGLIPRFLPKPSGSYRLRSLRQTRHGCWNDGADAAPILLAGVSIDPLTVSGLRA